MAAHAQSFNARAFLESEGLSRRIVAYRRDERIFAQGGPGASVMYVQNGAVKLSVLSKAGREAVVAMFGTGDFFGEGCLAGQPLRIATAIAIAPSSILVIEKAEMARVLHRERALSDRFIACMLSQNTRIEHDLIEQLFNSSEKRLARALLLLARYGKQVKPRLLVPAISPAILSATVGITKARVNYFMDKFRRLGFIEYSGNFKNGMRINNSLLSVVLKE